jgi:hypothetical protein
LIFSSFFAFADRKPYTLAMSKHEHAASLEAKAQTGVKLAGRGAAPFTWVNFASFAAYVIFLAVTSISVTGALGATPQGSRPYQTLVHPAGFAFSIWGPIFIWEGVFAVAQLLPQFRERPVVRAIAPFWWSVCFCQVAWSVVFGQDWLTAALVFILAILGSLLGLLWRAHTIECESIWEFWLLRAPFSLHTGWIIAASILSANVLADYAMATPAVLLALAVVSLAVIFALTSLFAIAGPRSDAIIPLVAAWALFAVSSELRDPVKLLDPARHNPVAWDPTVLDAVRIAASVLSLACLALSAVAAALRAHHSGISGICVRTPGSTEEQSVAPQEATLAV